MRYMREMGTQEKMDWIFNKVSPVNFVTYAQVRGDITEENLRFGLEDGTVLLHSLKGLYGIP